MTHFNSFTPAAHAALRERIAAAHKTITRALQHGVTITCHMLIYHRNINNPPQPCCPSLPFPRGQINYYRVRMT